MRYCRHLPQFIASSSSCLCVCVFVVVVVVVVVVIILNILVATPACMQLENNFRNLKDGHLGAHRGEKILRAPLTT